VAEALEGDGGRLTIEGAVVADKARPQQVCAGVDAEGRCEGPALKLVGLRDMSAFDHVDAHGGRTWVESATIGGRIDDGTLHIELACPAQRVERRFEDATGQALTLNPFGSTSGTAVLDVATVPEDLPTDVEREFGYFRVMVRLERAQRPFLWSELSGVRADARGIYWRREDEDWLAIKRYGRDLALVWLAPGSHRVDERWRRLDDAMRKIS
jgi:hypothetical protein